MKLKILKKETNYSDLVGDFTEVEIECEGDGTRENPAIIQFKEKLPTSFEIFESKNYILIRDVCFFDKESIFNPFSISRIGLYYSENITFENCDFYSLTIKNSSNINLINISSESLTIIESRKVRLENSRIINEFEIYKSKNNQILNCTFDCAFKNPKNLSFENVFQKNQISSEYKDQLLNFEDIDKEKNRTFTIRGEHYGVEKLIESEYTGKGTVDDPIMLKLPYKLPHLIRFYGNREHVVLENINSTYIELLNCKNITLKNCNYIKHVQFYYCSEIRLRENFIKNFRLIDCYQIIIEDSQFNNVKLAESNREIQFKRSKINLLSQNPFAQEIEFPNTEVKKVLELSKIRLFYIKNSFLIIMLSMISSVLLGILIPALLGFMLLTIVLPIIIFFIFFFIMLKSLSSIF